MNEKHRVGPILVGIACISGVLYSCGGKGPAEEPKETAKMTDLQGKSVVMIIASRQFRDEELLKPKAILEGAGATVTIASSSLNESKGMLGARAKPDTLLADVKVDDYDAIIFIGGSGASEHFDNTTAHQIAKDAAAAGKVLGAICIAPSTLARAGVLKDRKATCFSSRASDLKRCGANYTGAPVECDGKVITGEGPTAAEGFGQAIARALREE